jgi:predicted  nucleic acid-binding Zn-ribbon protein
MSQAEALYRVQTIDLQVEEKIRRLQEIEAHLGESDALRAARQALTEAEAHLAELRKTLRRQELDAHTVEAKIKADEGRLYGGKIRNPKELDGLKNAVDAEKRRLSALEDQVLETMLRIEQAEAQTQAARNRLRQVELAWGDEQTRLRREQRELQNLLAELTNAREDACLYVMEENLVVYDDLRRKKGGRAVVLLDGTLCRGCLVTLPLSDAQRARSGSGLTFCTHCGRVVYARESGNR